MKQLLHQFKQKDDHRLFIELQVQYKKTTSSVHVLTYFTQLVAFL